MADTAVRQEQRQKQVGAPPPRHRLLALVKAEAFTPYVRRRGEKLSLHPGDDAWFRDNVPCRQACPVHTDIPGYLALIAQGQYERAYALNEASNLFPEILGRICSRPCEAACRRALIDEPVAICHLKRAAVQLLRSRPEPFSWVRKPKTSTGRRVAVVGSGPAGLAAAVDLVMHGCAVTVYEAHGEPGGLLQRGIPPYRLPRGPVREMIKTLRKLGVEFKPNTRLDGGLSLDDLLAHHDAVLLALGAGRSARLNVPGEEAQGVLPGLAFMEAVNSGQGETLEAVRGRKVAVIGGGYTALDCARSAVRLGASRVLLLYRRTQAEMPVTPEEVQEAIDEGVKVQYLVSPLRISVRDGRVCGLECVRNRLGEPDESGRARPEPIAGSEFEAEADFVITAVSQAPDPELLQALGLQLRADGYPVVDPDTFMTERPGVFAAGDLVSGPRTVIEAIAAGRKAASAIARYLDSDADADLPTPAATEEAATRRDEEHALVSRRLNGEDDYEEIPRQPMPKVPLSERADIHREVELGYTEEQAQREARRCYRCQLNLFVDAKACILCNKCVEACPQDCLAIISFDLINNKDLPGLRGARAWLDGGALVIEEGRCTRCARCVRVCPPRCLTLDSVIPFDTLELRPGPRHHGGEVMRCAWL